MELNWKLLLDFYKNYTDFYNFDPSNGIQSIEKIISQQIFPNHIIFCRTTNYNIYFNHISPPTNAYDRDMNQYIHKKFVEAFNRLGFKANRNNSIYVFPNAFDVVYGDYYYIFVPYVHNIYYFTFGVNCWDLYGELKEYSEWKEIFPNLNIDENFLEDGEQTMINIAKMQLILYEEKQIKNQFSVINERAFLEIFDFKNENTATLSDMKESFYKRSEYLFNCKGDLINLDIIKDYFNVNRFENLNKVDSDKELRYGYDWEEYWDDEEDEEDSDEYMN